MDVEELVWIVDQAERELGEDQEGLGSGMKVETGGLRCFTKNMARIDEGPDSQRRGEVKSSKSSSREVGGWES